MVTAPSTTARALIRASLASCFAFQDLARHAGVAKPDREAFRLLDGEDPDEHGPPGRLRPPDPFDHPALGRPDG
jgi:hypothetical protein